MGRYSSVDFVIAFTFLFLLIKVAQFSSCANFTLSSKERERHALLKFKDSVNAPPMCLCSWEGNDFCKWKGVECDNISGHVVKLDLRNTFTSVASLQGFSNSCFPVNYSSSPAAEDFGPSLLELEYLNYLDLSGNNFLGIHIPMSIGSMKQLRYLNLSNSGFSGQVPHHLGNLSNLQILDLEQHDMRLYVDDISWVSQLSSLQYIDMSGVFIQEANDLMQVIHKLPSLLQVHLINCGIDNLGNSHGFLNSTFHQAKVHVLNLKGNSLSGPISDAFQGMTSIRVLDLSQNFFSSIPLWLDEFRNLVHLNLARNRLHGQIPYALQNLPSLRFLDLSYNSFIYSVPLWSIQGILQVNLTHNKFTNIECSPPWSMTNGSFERFEDDLQVLDLSYNEFHDDFSCLGNLKNLVFLNLASNSLSGPIPQSFEKLTNLRELILKDNQLNETIPVFLGQLSTLRVVDLSGNHLNGIIPDSLGKLWKLHVLDLSYNSLEGTLDEIHLSNLSNLQDLRMGFNKLAVKLAPNWLPTFQLASLELQSCKIETPFPQWLRTQTKLVKLDLSGTGIFGAIPNWFQQMGLIEFHLSNNRISRLPENLHDMMPKLSGLFLGSNLINGSIPSSFCKFQGLHNLDLSRNRFSNKIPDCLLQMEIVALVDLSSNVLSGTIPQLVCTSSSKDFNDVLQSLNLSNNSLHGEIPASLANCVVLQILDLGGNQLSGVIPSWIAETLAFLKILRLRQNKFNGSIPSSLCQLLDLKILDLASNNLTGRIPQCIGNLKGMMLDPSLDNGNEAFPPLFETMSPAVAVSPSPSVYSAYAPEFNQWDKEHVKQLIKGMEMDYSKILKLVVNLDLSNNKLIGFIPEGLVSLSKLVNLNFSHNNLSGVIPTKIGKVRSLESIDFSCNQFSGPIPNSISSLTLLSHLNLSYNNFSGPIPNDNQFSTLNDDPSIYAGNPYLFEIPLVKKRHGNDTHQAPTSINYEENHGNKDKIEKILFYFVIAVGFVMGFWGAIGVLLIKKSWRHAYFRYVEKVGDKIYVAIAIWVARLKKGTA